MTRVVRLDALHGVCDAVDEAPLALLSSAVAGALATIELVAVDDPEARDITPGSDDDWIPTEELIPDPMPLAVARRCVERCGEERRKALLARRKRRRRA